MSRKLNYGNTIRFVEGTVKTLKLSKCFKYFDDTFKFQMNGFLKTLRKIITEQQLCKANCLIKLVY